METIWPQIERHPAARCPSRPATSAASRDRSTPSTVRARWPGCCSTRTPTRSACPTRACRSSTRSSTSVPTPLAERAYAPWVDMEAAMRAAGVPLFSVEQHLPGAAFDVLAFNLSAELVYTNVVNLHRPGRPPAARGRARRRRRARASPAATAPSTPSRWPTSSTPSCSATARRSSARSTRWWRTGWPGRRDGARRATRCCRALAALEGVYVPALYDAVLRRTAAWSATVPVDPGVPAERRQAHRERPGRLALPGPAPGAADRGGPRPPQRRGVPRLHPRAAGSARPA